MRMIVRLSVAVLAMATLVSACGGAGTTGPVGDVESGNFTSSSRPKPSAVLRPQPMSTTRCRTELKIPCYVPQQIRKAYGVDQLLDNGTTGRDVTVITGAGRASPTLQQDLDAFSDQFGLPRTTLEIAHALNLPAFDLKADRRSAEEATLDVSAIHLMAPEAKIIVVEVPSTAKDPVDPDELLADFVKLTADDRGDVISMSWGGSERSLLSQLEKISPEQQAVVKQKLFGTLREVHGRGVTLVAASGDNGGQPPSAGVQWPSSEPWVTAVGGTDLDLDDAGNRRGPDVAWSGSGGGTSLIFTRPDYQRSVDSVVDERRGTPDISVLGGPGLWTHLSFDPGNTGWALLYGTSLAAPLFAGVIALANQEAGQRLGNVNHVLYRLAGMSDTGFRDVIGGQTTNGATRQPGAPAPPPGWQGYQAVAGYNLATGLGTINAPQLVASLTRP